MALQTDYYVDSSKSNDSGDGYTDTMNTAKQHLSAVVALLNETFTHDVTIHLKVDSTSYSGDVSFAALRALIGNYKLIIQPYSAWNQTNYDAAIVDPLGGSNGFDPSQATFGVIVEHMFNFAGCHNIEIRGLYFKGLSSGTGIAATDHSQVIAKYCRFEGPGCQSTAMFDSFFTAENCYFTNCPFALLGIFNSKIHVTGDTYIEDTLFEGLRVAVNSTLVVRPMDDHPEHHTLSIKTTLPRQKGYAAIRAVVGSTVCIADDSLLPQAMYPWYQPMIVKIHHANSVFRKEQYGLLLESGSIATGVSQVSFTMLDANGEIVAMPEGQTIVEKEDEGTKVVK